MGAPMKCKSCDARWYGMGSMYCRDCGSDDIDVDFAFYQKQQAKQQKADDRRRAKDARGKVR